MNPVKSSGADRVMGNKEEHILREVLFARVCPFDLLL